MPPLEVNVPRDGGDGLMVEQKVRVRIGGEREISGRRRKSTLGARRRSRKQDARAGSGEEALPRADVAMREYSHQLLDLMLDEAGIASSDGAVLTAVLNVELPADAARADERGEQQQLAELVELPSEEPEQPHGSLHTELSFKVEYKASQE